MPDKFGVFSVEERGHRFSVPLATSIVDFYRAHCKTGVPIFDYGCGDGSYVDFFIKENIAAIGIEGDTRGISAPSIQRNLCEPTGIGMRRFSVSLEVGEHIPPEYTGVFLANVTANAEYVALSWAVPGQTGLGHVNCMDNELVVFLMHQAGFVLMVAETIAARRSIPEGDGCSWFKNTFFFFKSSDKIPV